MEATTVWGAMTTSGRLGRCPPVRRTLTWVVLLPLLLATAGGLGSATAWASCVAPGAPGTLRSPNAFTGTVTATSSAGRVAEVLTDGGSHVTVIGTPAGPDPAGVSGRTSVDRTYEVGVRYAFDPRNSTSPYQDNACTGTHTLPPLAPTTSPAATASPPSAPTVSSPSAAGAGPDTGGGRPITITVIAIVAVVGLGVAAGAAAAAVRRHRTSRAHYRT